MRILKFALCIACVAAPLDAQTVTAFTGAIVVDGRGGPPLSNATVIVRGAMIEAVRQGNPGTAGFEKNSHSALFLGR